MTTHGSVESSAPGADTGAGLPSDAVIKVVLQGERAGGDPTSRIAPAATYGIPDAFEPVAGSDDRGSRPPRLRGEESMAIASQSLERFSRRHLFGSGLGRALDLHFSRLDGGRPARRRARESWAQPTWGEVDSTSLGLRLQPARQALLDATVPKAGGRLLDLSAGDGSLALEAARSGISVTAWEADAQLRERGRRRTGEDGVSVRWLPEGSGAGKEGGFDAVVSCFAASHGSDQRRLARRLTRAAYPGGAVALTAWKGLMATVMQISAPDRHGRSESWSRHETARTHFGELAALSVRQHFMCWQFADEQAALAELSAPVFSATGRRRLRDAMPDLIEMYGRHCESGLTLRADYVLVFARRP